MLNKDDSPKIYKKLIEHDKKFVAIDKRFEAVDQRFDKIEVTLRQHGDLLVDHGVQLLKLSEKVDRIDERTAFIPKMYQAVDAFMKEIRESRDDRVILGHRVSGHEERLEVVESALSIKPPSEVF
ncbi:MAG: hypothetical protein WC988_04165 [Patescibacteria group bacterium]